MSESTTPFAAGVVASIAKHMNEDHATDCLLIAVGLGGVENARRAVMSGMSREGLVLEITPGRNEPPVTVTIPWSIPIRDRADVRREAVRMVREAEARVPFSTRLRLRTWGAHEVAESNRFMQALLDGRLPIDAVALLVGQLRPVYGLLEAAATLMQNDPVARQFVFPELARGDSFARDWRALAGDARPPEPTDATERYVSRIREVCFTWPGGFVAHHYTRYLGDLSGGQVMRAALVSQYGLQDGRGVASLTFPEIADRNAFKAEYRRRLDRAPWTVDEQRRIIDEVVVAYRLNADLLASMSDRHGEVLGV